MTLGDLRPGEQGTITAIASGPAVARLMEMGLLPGTRVEVLRLAPLGDPIDLRVRGYRLCVRKVDADRVTVQKEVINSS